MQAFAQTNLQLYNQLRQQGRRDDELLLVRRCYDFASLVYSGFYQADGKPFVCHAVGVAGILAHLNLPAEMVGAGLIHNAFGNADFGDTLSHIVTPERRRRVREAVGEPVATLAEQFREFRITPLTIDRLEQALPDMSPAHRHLLLMDLADHLEKYIDLGVLYFGDATWITGATSAHGERLMQIARDLGHPELAQMLADSVAAAVAEPPVPDALRRPPDQRYLEQVIPLSCRPRLLPILRRRVRDLARKLRRRVAGRFAARRPLIDNRPPTA
jgi:hypothetical protein